MKDRIKTIGNLILKHWWKVAILVLCIVGLNLDIGNGFFKCNKEGVKIPGILEKK